MVSDGSVGRSCRARPGPLQAAIPVLWEAWPRHIDPFKNLRVAPVRAESFAFHDEAEEAAPQIEGGNVIHMKTVIVDDHPVVRKGLRLLMECEPRIEVVGEASNGLMALEAVRDLCPDLLLLDINMPEMSGLEVLRHLRDQSNFIPIIILSNHSDTRYVDAALEMGANGYVGKDSGFDVLMMAIEAIREGLPYIDPKIPRRAA